jgi:hypothetical protein
VQGDNTCRVLATPTGAVPDGLRSGVTVTIEIDGEAMGG